MTKRRSHQTPQNDYAAEPLLSENDQYDVEHRVNIGRTSAEPRSSADEERDSPQHQHRTPGAIRLTRRVSTHDVYHGEQEFTLALKEPDEEGDGKDDNVREVEVEVLTEAVAEAVAEAVNEVVQEAVQEAVTEAVHDAVAQAIEDNVNFDVRANVYTLVAVTGVILYWRGVWNSWDYLFGLSIWSEVACILTGLTIMMFIRLTNVPLAQGLPGG